MRQEAMKWWNPLPFEIKWEKIVKHKELVLGYPDRAPGDLTGSEIEKLFIKEKSAEKVYAIFFKLKAAQFYTFITTIPKEDLEELEEMRKQKNYEDSLQYGDGVFLLGEAVRTIDTKHAADLEWDTPVSKEKLVLHKDVDKFPIFRPENY